LIEDKNDALVIYINAVQCFFLNIYTYISFSYEQKNIRGIEWGFLKAKGSQPFLILLPLSIIIVLLKNTLVLTKNNIFKKLPLMAIF
jgi:hypothetical protein